MQNIGTRYLPVFRIWIRPDPKLIGLKDPDPKLLISDPDPDPAPAPDPPLFHTKLKNMFHKCTKKWTNSSYFHTQ